MPDHILEHSSFGPGFRFLLSDFRFYPWAWISKRRRAEDCPPYRSRLCKGFPSVSSVKSVVNGGY